MTAEEISVRYHIPPDVLEEYRSWGLCGAVKIAADNWQYDERDLERLSTIMALYDMGFQIEEIEIYMRLLIQGETTRMERLQILDRKRSTVLDEIHLKERQLERMDYLRVKIRENNEKM